MVPTLSSQEVRKCILPIAMQQTAHTFVIMCSYTCAHAERMDGWGMLSGWVEEMVSGWVGPMLSGWVGACAEWMEHTLSGWAHACSVSGWGTW